MRVLLNILSMAVGFVLLAGGTEAVYAAGKPTTSTKCVTYKNPMSPAEEGRRAYIRMNCYSCHGAGAHGGGMGPSLYGEAGSVNGAVPGGRAGGMPAFKNYLCANDTANLSAYLDSLGTASEPKFTNWWQDPPEDRYVGQ